MAEGLPTDIDWCFSRFDERSCHLAAWSSAHAAPLAYARLVTPRGNCSEPSMGRVISTAPARGQGPGARAGAPLDHGQRNGASHAGDAHLGGGRGVRPSGQAANHLLP
jgi:hypothetical protein